MPSEHSELLLHGYFDGELDLVRSLEFEDHLKTCAECARELRDQRALRESLRAANLYQHAPAGLHSRVRASLPQAAPAHAVRPRRFAFEWIAVAAVVLLAVFLGARLLPEISGRSAERAMAQEILSSHIRSLQPGHLFDVQSSDQHTVKPWFGGKLDFAPPVVDLTDHGFPLVGGRLDYLAHRNVAALVYQRQKHFINVFVWPGEPNSARLPEAQAVQGYNLMFWTRDGMNFCAVSDLNLAELREFARFLQR